MVFSVNPFSVERLDWVIIAITQVLKSSFAANIPFLVFDGRSGDCWREIWMIETLFPSFKGFTERVTGPASTGLKSWTWEFIGSG